MRTKKDFILRKMNGMNLVVAVGKAVKTFNGYVTLNETGCFLWEKLSAGATEDELVAALLDEYDVEKAVAEKDVRAFLDTLYNNDLIEE